MDYPDTILAIVGPGIPAFSARGLTQTLDYIGQASKLLRTARGKLVDVSNDKFRLFASTISCSDVNVPAVAQWAPGRSVTVHCVVELSYPADSEAEAIRAAVPGSERTEEGYIFYRPVLQMIIVGFSQGKAEYDGVTAWSLQLEEEGDD